MTEQRRPYHWVLVVVIALALAGGMSALGQTGSGPAVARPAAVSPAADDNPATISAGDTAWVLLSAAPGAGLLWFGWFGFNAGSALSAGTLATTAFLATHVASAVAGLIWIFLDWVRFGKPTTLGMITGAVAGLAAVTPGAGFVDASGAIWIGLGSGMVCWVSVTYMKAKLGYDDTLDAFGVHGVGGIWGTLAAGIWATKAVNPRGPDGLAYGNPMQLLYQAKAVGIVMVYSFVVSVVLFKLVDVLVGLRVTEHAERVGLDLSEHKEAGYTVID